jgi:Phosphatidylserine/phosphatidylglycerophosphate/cardiolipin synthases and related enzymes
VIDGRIGYTGSQNLVDADFKPGILYEELVVRVTGPVVLQLQAVFVSDWFVETEEMLDSAEVAPEPTGSGAVVAQVMPSGPDYPATNVQRLVVALVTRPRSVLSSRRPTSSRTTRCSWRWKTAVRRGVEVHLVVSRIADQVLVSLAQKSYYEQLLEAGVHIHLYREKFCTPST